MDWAFRLDKEKSASTSALFITLTYAQEYLPLDKNGLAHVSKRDCQNFLKRLRKYVSQRVPEDYTKLRFYLSSEYGPETHRPHYHMLLFNFPIYDIEPYETIFKCWNMGLVQVGALRDGGAAYAAKYIMHPYDDLPPTLTRPFALMSRRPGIGFGYVTETIKKYFNQNETFLATLNGGRRVPLPRYLRQKIFDEETLHRLSREHLEAAKLAAKEQFKKDCKTQGKRRAIFLCADRARAYENRVKNILKKNKGSLH